MSETEIYAIVRTVLYYTGAGVCVILSAWTIFATIVEVARGKSRPLERDVLVAVLFHGGLAVLALKLANLAFTGEGWTTLK